MKLAAVVVAGFLVAPYAVGQKLELKLDAIAARASAKNEVDLDGPLLQMALGKASEAAKEGKDGKKSSLPALLAGVKGVYVRNYEFEKSGVYSDAELDPSASRWVVRPAGRASSTSRRRTSRPRSTC